MCIILTRRETSNTIPLRVPLLAVHVQLQLLLRYYVVLLSIFVNASGYPRLYEVIVPLFSKCLVYLNYVMGCVGVTFIWYIFMYCHVY
jgi:hypothetical protein